MKKLLSIMLVFAIVFTAMSVTAEEFNNEEDFSFDAYDSFDVIASDEAVLMEIDVDVKDALEEKLLAAWDSLAAEVQLYPDVKIHRNDIVSYFSTIFFENPQYYYVVRKFSATTNSAGYIGKLYNLVYSVDDMESVNKTREKIDGAVKEILFNISCDMTDFEKVMTVHDYMVNNYIYDISDADQTYLILLDKVGVCAAYAEAFQHVMNVIGIESTIVKSDSMGHMWNMVKIDGRWYHADVTWDDPDQMGRISHQHMFLSQNAIEDLGHYGIDAPYNAISTVYNNAEWHDDMSAMVTAEGVMYCVEGNNLIDETGNIIYEKLDGGDGFWATTQTTGVKDEIFASLCEINGVLYFNTDTGIYSYNPKTRETATVLEEYGIFGLYSDKNMIYYSTYDFEEQAFVKKGELKVCGSFVKESYYEDGKAVVKLYNDNDSPIWVISEGEGYKICKVEAKSVDIIEFENGTGQTIYVWTQGLQPVVESFMVSE